MLKHYLILNFGLNHNLNTGHYNHVIFNRLFLKSVGPSISISFTYIMTMRKRLTSSADITAHVIAIHFIPSQYTDDGRTMSERGRRCGDDTHFMCTALNSTSKSDLEFLFLRAKK